MRRFRSIAGMVVLLAGINSAQTAPGFDPETADVHASPSGEKQDMAVLPRSGLDLRGQTMINLISFAYGMEDKSVIGGPPWLVTDRFDIAAKTPSASTFEELQKVLQSILEARFHLAAHKDERSFPVFYLTVGKKPSLRENKNEGVGDCKLAVQNLVRTYTCTHVSMGDFAQRIRGVAAAYFNQPVIDHTGLKGFYDFSLSWTGRANLNPSGDDAARGVTAFEAVEKDMGLKAEPGSEKLPVIVLDRVDRTPTPNGPNVVTKVRNEPTEFDVAEIHPKRPGSAERESTVQNGRVELFDVSLKELLNFAYDFDERMVVGGDKWVETDTFDLVAKSAPTTSIEALRGMLKKLLIDSFKLKTREEMRPMDVYALTIGKGSKLRPTDGTGRGCTGGARDGMSGFVCKNATIEQLIEQLRRARGYIALPVIDQTGVTGAYDFELYWTPVNRLMGNSKGAGAASEAARAADPNGFSVFEAIDRQLGLKLAQTKQPLKVLVIEHAEKPAN